MKQSSKPQNRKPLEGIDALLFILGGVAAYVLTSMQAPALLTIVIMVVSALTFEKIVDFLKVKNIELNTKSRK
jgi:hypothetical protein